jgi:hypothetical protein
MVQFVKKSSLDTSWMGIWLRLDSNYDLFRLLYFPFMGDNSRKKDFDPAFHYPMGFKCLLESDFFQISSS